MNDKELDEILDDLNLRHFAKGRKDLLPELLIAKKQLQSLLKQAELRGELKAHNRYEIVPIKNIRSHMVARKKIIEAEMEEK